MRIDYHNQERYIKKTLTKIIRKMCYNWLIDDYPLTSRFRLNKAVHDRGKVKMEQVKRCVYEEVFLHENAWKIHDKIKDFQVLDDLLNYLADEKYCNPEHVLLDIIRATNGLLIMNDEERDCYYVKKIYQDNLPASKEELKTDIKKFIISYVRIVFDIKKTVLSLNDLYQALIQEEIPYSAAREGRYIEELSRMNNLAMKEIIMLANEGKWLAPFAIFSDIITHDYHHFKKVKENYYLCKDWDEELMETICQEINC